MNVYNIDELGFYHGKHSIVGEIYFQLLIQRNRNFFFNFIAIWIPMATWLVG
jgi:hypothetical protein